MRARKRALWLVFGFVCFSILATVGIFFYLDSTMDRSGWLQDGGKYYFLDPKGQPRIGWIEDDGCLYYFGQDGAMVTGWQEIDGGRYYFGGGGVLRTGWLELNGQVWYLREDGVPVTGWQTVDGERRYFHQDGTLATGWQDIDGSRYYLGNEGVIATGWVRLPEGSYYLDGSGHVCTGLTVLDGKSYYFFEGSGIMATGWLDFGNERFYFDDDGVMVTGGWQLVEGKERCFGEDGRLVTGWMQDGEYSYYLLEDGTKATSPTVVDGETCFFTPEGIYIMLVNYQYPLPQNYQPDLVRYGEWARVAKVAEQHLRQMILDCRATGIECWLNCGYRTQDEQVKILEERIDEYMEKRGMSADEAEAEALKTVAVPGFSEHQTGYAMDIVCSVTPTWLHEHCWEYGFILRYPENKSDITHIDFEHWHYRYVGTEVSMAMKDTGLCLEEYLGAA